MAEQIVTENVDQFTPGPWKASQLLYGGGAYWVETVEPYKSIACLITYPEVEANARLIAAAPELLSALKQTLDYWTGVRFAECDEGCDCIVETVRAAIAKAEGR